MALANLNEEENKPNEFPSVKFLLKQVYGSHISKVRALEAELKELKESKSGTLKRDVAESNSQCNHCKDLQTALNSCRQEYKETTIKQSEKLEYLEQQLTLLHSRNLRLPEQRQDYLFSPHVSIRKETIQKDDIHRLKVSHSNNSEAKFRKPSCVVLDESMHDSKVEISSTVCLKSEESSPCNEEHLLLKNEKIEPSFYDNESFSSQLQNSFCDYLPHEPNIILVPETLDTTEYITSNELSPVCFSKSFEKAVNKFESPRKVDEIRQHDNNYSEQTNQKLCRKRACSSSPFKDKKMSKTFNDNKCNELPNASKSPVKLIDKHKSPVKLIDKHKSPVKLIDKHKSPVKFIDKHKTVKLISIVKSPVRKLTVNGSKEENLSIISNQDVKYSDTTVTSEEKVHTNVKNKDSDSRFNSHHDSSDFTLKSKSPSLLNCYNSKQALNPVISHNDNVHVKTNNSKLSQTCVKANKKLGKKSKTIKSISHLKTVLDSPNIDFRKPQYKQTKLSRNTFKQTNCSIKDGTNSSKKVKTETSNQNDKSKVEIPNFILKTKSIEKISSKTDSSKTAWEVMSISNNIADSKLLIADIDATFLPEDYKLSEQVLDDTDTVTNSPITLNSRRSCIKYEDIDILESSIDHDSEDLLQAVRNEIYEKEAHSEEMEKYEGEFLDAEESEKPDEICDSFDIMPSSEKPNYKYKENPVRKKDKRRQLKGYDCKECEKYYSGLGLSEQEKEQRLKQCSRHRAMYVPPSTPEHFWELEFPDTEECKVRGYQAETQKIKLKSRRRRPLQ